MTLKKSLIIFRLALSLPILPIFICLAFLQAIAICVGWVLHGENRWQYFLDNHALEWWEFRIFELFSKEPK